MQISTRFVVGSILSSLTLNAQFYSYEQIQESERRAAEAQTKFLISCTIIGIIASVLLLRAILHFRTRIKPGQVPDVTTKPPSPGFSSLLRSLGIAFKVLAVVSAVGYFVSCSSETADSVTISGGEAYFLVGSFMWLGSLLASQAARLQTPLAEVLLISDQRPPILFFRTFSEEGISLSRDDQWWLESSIPELLEEIVLSEFRKVGPVVGLTNPRLQDRPSSYAPYDTKVANWRERVEELLGQAAAVVVTVAVGDGLLWEIHQLRQSARLQRTAFMLPPLSPQDLKGRLGWLMSALCAPEDIECKRLVVSQLGTPQELALVFRDGHCKVYLANPDAQGYALVIPQLLQDIGL